MSQVRSKIKRVATDAAGVILILAAIFLGWLPGIGGIPLFIAGLALLSVNNQWAKRWLDYARKHSSRIGDIIFANNPKLLWLNDALTIIFAAISVFLLVKYDGYITRTIAFFVLATSLGLFFGNRKRLQNWLKNFRS